MSPDLFTAALLSSPKLHRRTISSAAASPTGHPKNSANIFTCAVGSPFSSSTDPPLPPPSTALPRTSSTSSRNGTAKPPCPSGSSSRTPPCKSEEFKLPDKTWYGMCVLKIRVPPDSSDGAAGPAGLAAKTSNSSEGTSKWGWLWFKESREEEWVMA
nr:hypothetical protein Iba_chr02bCG1810 [Ipomoea batatas]